MKVLIISHNPMSSLYSIGKTLLSLFADFKKEELCQLYVHTGTPDHDVCQSYYRITDKSVLRGFFTRSVRGSEVQAKQEQWSEAKNDLFFKSTYGNKHRRDPGVELGRDLMWKLSPWYDRKLGEWLNEQRPTCIFVAVGSSKFLYDMALRIAEAYHIPICAYVCDDFYSMKSPRSPLGPLWKWLLNRKSHQLFEQASRIVSICSEMSLVYEREFKTPAATIMTGTSYAVADAAKVSGEVQFIRYFGKLSLNRYKSLAQICRAIDRINIDMGSNYAVEIYCFEVDDEIKKEFSDIRCAHFCGFITGEEFKATMQSSDVLLHIEAFDLQSIDRVRHSVSTKIADSVASGIPLFAYGPEGIASLNHLIRNGCGVVATDADQLDLKLRRLLTDPAFRGQVSQRQIDTAREFHDSEKNSICLRHVMENL